MKRRMALILIFLLILLFPSKMFVSANSIQNGERIIVPFLSQNADPWNNYRINETSYTFDDSGCLLTSTAMLLQYYGFPSQPGDVNHAFKGDGFSGANMIWGKNSQQIWDTLTHGTLTPEEIWVFSEDVLIKNLDEGIPVIVSLHNGTSTTGDAQAHFVVVTGYEFVEDGNSLGKTRLQLYINDPEKNDETQGKGIRIEENVLGAEVTIGQMKFLAYKGEQIHGEPVSDPESIFLEGGTGSEVVKYEYSDGFIYQSRRSSSSEWQYAWIPSEIAAIYDPTIHGLLLRDTYANLSRFGDFTLKADAEFASILYELEEGETTALDKANGVFVEYFNSGNMDKMPDLSRFEKSTNYYAWGSVPPHPDLKPSFAIRLTKKITFSIPWRRTISLTYTDGIRVFYDNEKIFEDWDAAGWSSKQISFWDRKGDHELVLEYSKRSELSELYVALTAWPVEPVYAESGNTGGFDAVPYSASGVVDVQPTTINPPPIGSVVVDDLDKDFSFVQDDFHGQEALSGYRRHHYWIENPLVNPVARWDIKDQESNTYELFSYIPYTYSNCSTALYTIHAGDHSIFKEIDQGKSLNEWVALGKIEHEFGNRFFVEISSGDGCSGSLVVDAVAYRSSNSLPSFGDGENDLLESIRKWFGDLIENLKNQAKMWVQEQIKTMDRKLQEWLKTNAERILYEILVWLDQQCCSTLVLPIGMSLGVFAFKTRKNKIPRRSRSGD